MGRIKKWWCQSRGWALLIKLTFRDENGKDLYILEQEFVSTKDTPPFFADKITYCNKPNLSGIYFIYQIDHTETIRVFGRWAEQIRGRANNGIIEWNVIYRQIKLGFTTWSGVEL